MSEINLYHGPANGGYKGFGITFENGVTASIQFGKGESCSPANEYPERTEAMNAECAALYNNEFVTKFIVPEMVGIDDEIICYASPDEIADFIKKCKDWGRDNENC